MTFNKIQPFGYLMALIVRSNVASFWAATTRSFDQ